VADTPAGRRPAVLGDPGAPPDRHGDTAAVRAAAAEASPGLAELEGLAPGLEQSPAARGQPVEAGLPVAEGQERTKRSQARRICTSKRRTKSGTGPPPKSGRVLKRVITRFSAAGSEWLKVLHRSRSRSHELVDCCVQRPAAAHVLSHPDRGKGAIVRHPGRRPPKTRHRLLDLVRQHRQRIDLPHDRRDDRRPQPSQVLETPQLSALPVPHDQRDKTAQTVCSGCRSGIVQRETAGGRPKRLAQSYGPTPSTQTPQDQLFGPWPHGSYQRSTRARRVRYR
jgi:hypothetical protein